MICNLRDHSVFTHPFPSAVVIVLRIVVHPVDVFVFFLDAVIFCVIKLVFPTVVFAADISLLIVLTPQKVVLFIFAMVTVVTCCSLLPGNIFFVTRVSGQ